MRSTWAWPLSVQSDLAPRWPQDSYFPKRARVEIRLLLSDERPDGTVLLLLLRDGGDERLIPRLLVGRDEAVAGALAVCQKLFELDFECLMLLASAESHQLPGITIDAVYWRGGVEGCKGHRHCKVGADHRKLQDGSSDGEKG